MSRLASVVMTVGMVSILAALAPAQAPVSGGPGQYIGAAQGVLLALPEVQKELKLDASQVEKANALSTKIREDFAAIRPQMSGLPRDAAQAKMVELTTPIIEDSMKTARSFLTPEQIKRFHQLDVQFQGVLAMTYPVIVKKLGITEEQGPKIRAIIVEWQSETVKLIKANNNDRQAAGPRIMATKKEALAKVVALLTDDQKKAWNELIGEPFDVPMLKPQAR